MDSALNEIELEGTFPPIFNISYLFSYGKRLHLVKRNMADFNKQTNTHTLISRKASNKPRKRNCLQL